MTGNDGGVGGSHGAEHMRRLPHAERRHAGLLARVASATYSSRVRGLAWLSTMRAMSSRDRR